MYPLLLTQTVPSCSCVFLAESIWVSLKFWWCSLSRQRLRSFRQPSTHSHRSQPWSATVSRLWNGMFSESVWSFEINWIFMWTNQTESDDHPCSGSPADLQRAKLGVKSNVLREDAYCADWQTMAWNTFQTNNLIIRNLQPQHAQCAPVCHRKPKIPRL